MQVSDRLEDMNGKVGANGPNVLMFLTGDRCQVKNRPNRFVRFIKFDMVNIRYIPDISDFEAH